jgi:hypothetical protein
VPGKKTTKPSRSIRYLLSADRTLQRLSLRRLSKRAKKQRHSTQSNRSRSAARAKNSASGSWSISSLAIALAVICVATTAALIAARQPSHSASVASVDAPTDATASLKQVPAPVEPKTTTVAKAAVSTAVRTSAAPPSRPKTPAGAMTKAPAVESVMTGPASSTTKVDASDSAQLTISGCLQADGQSFWLKDTSGVDAPRSRSWRSGFLKKRSASVDVVAASDTLKLTNYVGQRVAATGTLLNREMRAHSLRRLADSCK